MSEWKEPHAIWIVGHRGAPAPGAREHDREPRLRRELRRRRRRVRRAADARRRGRALPRRGRRARDAAHPGAQLHVARDREALDPVGVRRVPDPEARAGLPSLRPGAALRRRGQVRKRHAARHDGPPRREARGRLRGGRPVSRGVVRRRVPQAHARDRAGNRDELPLRPSGRAAVSVAADAALSAGGRDRAPARPRVAGAPRAGRRGGSHRPSLDGRRGGGDPQPARRPASPRSRRTPPTLPWRSAREPRRTRPGSRFPRRNEEAACRSSDCC